MPQIPLEIWIQLLNKYLIAAEQAIENDDVEARKELRGKLHAFIRRTPQKYEFLDDIVRDVLQDINEFDLNLATRNIKKATRELEKQRAIIALATKEANEGAKKIQLEHLVEKLDQTKDIIEKMEGTVDILSDEDTSFMEKVKDLKTKIDDFKNLM